LPTALTNPCLMSMGDGFEYVLVLCSILPISTHPQ
jgi:hypothetical protein